MGHQFAGGNSKLVSRIGVPNIAPAADCRSWTADAPGGVSSNSGCNRDTRRWSASETAEKTGNQSLLRTHQQFEQRDHPARPCDPVAHRLVAGRRQDPKQLGRRHRDRGLSLPVCV